MRFVATVGIGIASALLSCAFPPAQRNTEPPASASTSKKSSIDQDGFDRTLRRILWESTSLFRDLEGVRLENRLREYYYQPKIDLPGASYCRILKHEGTTLYTCEWEDRQTVNDWYKRLVAAIERSLGPEWNKRSGSRQTGQQTLFFRGGKPTVQVIWEQKAAVVHVVVLRGGASQEGIRTDLPLLPDFFHPRSPSAGPLPPVCALRTVIVSGLGQLFRRPHSWLERVSDTSSLARIYGFKLNSDRSALRRNRRPGRRAGCTWTVTACD